MLPKSKVQPAKNRVLSVLRWESYKVTGSIFAMRCGGSGDEAKMGASRESGVGSRIK